MRRPIRGSSCTWGKHLASMNLVPRRQAEPGSEVLGAGPLRHVGPAFADQLHRDMRPQAMDPSQVDAVQGEQGLEHVRLQFIGRVALPGARLGQGWLRCGGIGSQFGQCALNLFVASCDPGPISRWPMAGRIGLQVGLAQRNPTSHAPYISWAAKVGLRCANPTYGLARAWSRGGCGVAASDRSFVSALSISSSHPAT